MYIPVERRGRQRPAGLVRGETYRLCWDVSVCHQYVWANELHAARPLSQLLAVDDERPSSMLIHTRLPSPTVTSPPRNSIQINTGVEVIVENLLPEVRKMFPRGWRLREAFYEPRAKNFQRRLMTPVTICFAIPVPQNQKKILTKIISTKKP